jgi:PAS domain S-box-containing protein
MGSRRPDSQPEDPAAVLWQVLSTTAELVAVIDMGSKRVVAASKPLAAKFRDLDLTGRPVRRFLVGGPSEAYALLADGQLEGYELSRDIRLLGGPETAYIWVHAMGDERPPRLAIVVVETREPRTSAFPARSAPRLTVLGTVDDEWRIDRLSVEATELLGAGPAELHGTSILGIVHPGDLGEFLTSLGHARATDSGVAVRVRLCHRDGSWTWSRVKLSPLGDRAGFAFALRPTESGDSHQDHVRDLEHRIARIAQEVHSAKTVRRVAGMPSLIELPELGKLTSREWEIVMEIRANARVSEVARTLHLSQSTVRNHLSAVYRKLGVGSLAELLVLLHAAEPAAREAG